MRKMAEVAALIEKILTAKKIVGSSPTMTENESATMTKDADTSELERQIDQIVYELYGLTDEEVKAVEGK